MISACGHHSGRPNVEKVCAYDEIASEWDMGSSSEINFFLRDFNELVGKYVENFGSAHQGNETRKRNVNRRKLSEFCDENELCVANT